jgi:L-lactate utilization protein LutB
MADTGVYSNDVRELGNKTLADPHLQEAYRSSTLRLYTHRLEAIAEVPGWQRLRDRGEAARCTGPRRPRTPAG